MTQRRSASAVRARGLAVLVGAVTVTAMLMCHRPAPLPSRPGSSPDDVLAAGGLWALWLVAVYTLVLLSLAAVALLVRRDLPRPVRALVRRGPWRLVTVLLGVGLAAAPAAPALGATTPHPPLTSVDAFAWLPTSAGVPLAAPPPARPPDRLRVRPGDTLWSIAARALGTDDPRAVAAEWPRWYAANRSTIGPDPGVIRPGQTLRAPASLRSSTSRRPS